MNPREIYQRLSEAANLDAAVAALSPSALTGVAAYISGLPRGGGVPAQIFGVVSAKLGSGKARKSQPPVKKP